jgi:hypothetical protein
MRFDSLNDDALIAVPEFTKMGFGTGDIAEAMHRATFPGSWPT